jgi:hypothetical protein
MEFKLMAEVNPLYGVHEELEEKYKPGVQGFDSGKMSYMLNGSRLKSAHKI